MSIRLSVVALMFLAMGVFDLWPGLPAESQSEQVVDVIIKDFTFVTKQGALRLGLPAVITDSQRRRGTT